MSLLIGVGSQYVKQSRPGKKGQPQHVWELMHFLLSRRQARRLGQAQSSHCQTWEEGGKRWEGEASPVEAPLPPPAHRKKRCSDCGGEMRWVSRPGLMSRTPNPLHTRDAFPLIRRHMLKMGRPYKWLPQKRKQAWNSGYIFLSYLSFFHISGRFGWIESHKTIILLIENHKIQLCYNMFE